MATDLWWKTVKPRKEVREGRSFNPDEFAIALEQVVAGTAPEDYKDPKQFFARTVFTRALTEHAGIVLRRLDGQTANSPPVTALVTQFGGGKTHTLTALYHLASLGSGADGMTGVRAVLDAAGVKSVPKAKVAVFVGNAWDPRPGRETPWVDVARQLAGDAGVAALGPSASSSPPGTTNLGDVFKAAGAPVLILCDEVLNYVSRHRDMAESFRDFLQNLTVAATGTERVSVMVSLPRSQVELTDWDLEWHDKVTKVVRRVAKDLIVNDEGEISEVVRRRLFEDLGDEGVRRRVATEYASWCFERRAQLPPEWTAIDTANTEKKSKEFLRDRFEKCYPFHPSTLSVFQRKWQTLPQYQQTRGTLAMLAQWVSKAYQSGFTEARDESLITLGSAPLDAMEFRGVVLGQLGESRLIAGIDADIAGPQAHARALDADAKSLLRDIHRRVGTVILFESSGGQTEKVARLPELRFALGETGVDTTSIDTAAAALESHSFYIRRVGADGYRIGYKPKLNKVVNDRRASLDEEADIKPEIRRVVKSEFERGAPVPIVFFPADSSAINDATRLTVIVADPGWEWSSKGDLRKTIAEWTRQRGSSDRLYPGALVWCIRKPGRDLRDKMELLLAWRRVQREMQDGTLGAEFDTSDRTEVKAKTIDADDATKDEVWADYRYIVVADSKEADGLKVIDLGAGHSSATETLCGRVISALRSEGKLNESLGSGYIDRNWPPALKESGAWPLSGLRQAFVNGSGDFTRLIDPDRTLRTKLVEFVEQGEFGLASGHQLDGSYSRLWYEEAVSPDEVAFEADVFLIRKSKAIELKTASGTPATNTEEGAVVEDGGTAKPEDEGKGETPEVEAGATRAVRLYGSIKPEIWNRFGTRVLPKMGTGTNLTVHVELTTNVDGASAKQLELDLRQILDDVGLSDSVQID